MPQIVQTVDATKGIKWQLVPPHIQRRNAAERAVRTFKNHFIAGLSGLDPEFPPALWDELLPQAELTLNLLRASQLNPLISAWMQLSGVYDFHIQLALLVVRSSSSKRQNNAARGRDMASKDGAWDLTWKHNRL